MLVAQNILEESGSASEKAYTITAPVEQSSITDKLGIFGSTLCLIHCLLLPLLLPLFSTSTYSPDDSGMESWFHDAIFPALLLVAVLAFSRGYKVHHSKFILSLGVFGILTISSGLLSEHLSSFKTPSFTTAIGSTLLVIAHILNISQLKKIRSHVHSSSCGCGIRPKGETSGKLVQLQSFKS